MFDPRRLALTALLALLVLPTARAETRVLLVGDSWAQFFWVNRTLRDVFAANGRPDLEEEGRVTAIGGTTAAAWATPLGLALITEELDAEPTIDTVQLTIGGNDVLAGQGDGGWFVGLPPGELDALMARIATDVATVVDHVLAHDPSLEVVVSLYDYVNFVDSLAFSSCASTWGDLGEPTPGQINGALVQLRNSVATVVSARPRATLVDHRGLMQFTYGFPEEGIAPGELLPPGDPERPSPIEAMFLGLDCIHLGSAGYEVLGQNLWDRYYAGRFAELVVPGRLRFTTGETTVGEGDGDARIEVERIDGTDGAVGATWTVVADTAGDDDLTLDTGSVAFDDGDAGPSVFTVPIVDDEIPEGLETARIVLSAPSGGAGLASPDELLLRIVDDDLDGPCVESATVRCLRRGRFRVEVEWRDAEGSTGRGTSAPLGSDDSALFWFFSPENWELLVKVLDGCGNNGHYWVFSAATTEVELTLRVLDLESGLVRVYTNPLGVRADAVTDTFAFATCP